MKMKLALRVPAALLVDGINAYSTAGADRKSAFHRTGKLFLKDVAAALVLPKGSFDIRSNMGGMAVSGEVTLHGESLYVQLSESVCGPGVSILFRSCEGRKDCTGGRNNFESMKSLAEDQSAQERFISRCRSLTEEGGDAARYACAS